MKKKHGQSFNLQMVSSSCLSLFFLKKKTQVLKEPIAGHMFVSCRRMHNEGLDFEGVPEVPFSASPWVQVGSQNGEVGNMGPRSNRRVEGHQRGIRLNNQLPRKKSMFVFFAHGHWSGSGYS